jgi:hypothetical protein
MNTKQHFLGYRRNLAAWVDMMRGREESQGVQPTKNQRLRAFMLPLRLPKTAVKLRRECVHPGAFEDVTFCVDSHPSLCNPKSLTYKELGNETEAFVDKMKKVNNTRSVAGTKMATGGVSARKTKVEEDRKSVV